MGVVTGPSVSCAQFEVFLLLLTDAGVAVLGEEVSVGMWAAGAAPAPNGRAVHIAPPVGTGGENAGLYG